MVIPACVCRWDLAKPPPLKRRGTITGHRLSECCSPGLQTRGLFLTLKITSPSQRGRRRSCGALAIVAAFNSRNFYICWIFSALQRCNPSADCYSQGFECQPSVSVRKSLDLCKSGLKKVLSALAIRSRIVMERRCDLDQALQEHFFRIESLQPDFLPMFVGFKKAPGIEVFKSLPKQAIFVVRIHETFRAANAHARRSRAS
jgi:hypothetical protein